MIANFLSNRKSWMKFGKWSLAVLVVFLLGFFAVQYVIPILAATGLPTRVSDVAVNITSPVNNSYTSLSNVNFTYNITWYSAFVDVKNCTLWGNLTGDFTPNVTNTTKILNDTINGLNTSVVDGVYLWNVICYNKTSHGNYSDYNNTLTVDLTNPIIKTVYPNNGRYFNTTSLNFSVDLIEANRNISINATVYFRRIGIGSYQSGTLVCGGSAPNYVCNVTKDLSALIALGEGEVMEFFYNTTDLAGRSGVNGTQTTPLTATLDTIVPGSPTSLIPTGNSSTLYFNTTTLMFNWTAPTDATSGIQKYKIYISDNASTYLFNGTNTTTTGYEFTGANAQNYSVKVTAVDNAENENTTGTTSIVMFVDTTPPTLVTGLKATNNVTVSYFNTTTLMFNWTASTDALSGVQYYKIYVNDSNNALGNGGYLFNGTNTSLTGYSFTGSHNRNYTVNVTSVDIANRENVGSSSTIMTVDTSAPSQVTSLRPTGNSSTLYFNTTTLMFNWTASVDVTSGVQYYRIYVNDNSAGYVYNGTNTTTTGYSFTGINGNNYSVNVTAVDNATNENTGATSATMFVDTVPPGLVTGLTITGNYTVNYYNKTTLTFNWTAPTDALSGVQYYKIYVNESNSGNIFNGTNTSLTSYEFTGGDSNNYTVNVTAVDIANNENTGSNTTIIRVDVSVPTSPLAVVFASDPSASFDDDTTLIVNWTAGSDAVSGIQYYNIYVNDTFAAYSLNGTSTTTGYSFTGANGRNYTVKVTSVDNANNENATGNFSGTIVVDTTNPVINNVVPTNGGYFKTPSSVLFRATFTEQNRDNSINVTLYYRRSGVGSYLSDTLLCEGTAPDYTCSKTKDLSAIIGNGEVLQYFFNTTDSAGRTAVNGTQTIPLTATADTVSPNYTSSSTNVSTIKIGDPLLIYTYWIDNVGLSQAWLWTNETSEAGNNWTIYNSPYNLAGNTTYWTNFTWQNGSIGVGTILGWKIYANDSAGNENVTTQGSFTVDGTKPTFYSNGTNVTATVITRNTTISIYYNWTDNVGLGYAWLSTNETTSWVNYSSSLRFIDINLTGTQTWSNFTWVNTSVSPGMAIGFKVFANDTSGNQNVSSELVWTVDNTVPTYINNTTSVSSGETIVKGTEISLAALWTDAELAYGWIEDNRTGSLANTSVPIVSNWTNYTFTTSSLTLGSLYTARLFANDSSGNENPTAPVWNWTIDGAAPTYWNKSDSTVVGDAVYSPGANYTFNISWTDNLGVGNVSHVIMEWNGTRNYTSATNPAVMSWGHSNYSVNFTDLERRNYTYRWYANDTSGNWNVTSNYTFNITQNTTNQITMYLVNSTDTVTNGNTTISAGNTATVNGTFTYVNSGTMALYSNVTTGSTALANVGSPYTTLTSLAAGFYVFIANTTGNENYTANATGPGIFYLNVTADVTAPTVQLYDYTNYTVRKSGSTLNLNISVTDATGVSAGEVCNVTISGTRNTSITYSSGWCNGTITVPHVPSDGNYTIIINVTDNSTNHNVGTNNSYVLTVDNTTPVVTVSFPQNGTYNKSVSSGYLWINGSVYDLISIGIGNVSVNSTYFNASNNYGPYNFTGVNNSEFAFRNATMVPDGYYAVKVSFTDNATNTGEATVYFYVDNTPPSSAAGLTNSTLGNKYAPTTSQTIQVSVTDALQTNASITLNYKLPLKEHWNTTTMSGTPGATTQYTATIDTSEVGQYQNVSYYITGYDNATNSIAASIGGSSASPLARITIEINTTGLIQGYVYLTNTSLAPNATVQVSDGTRTANTNTAGLYQITGVPAGTYTLTASGIGYWANSTSVAVTAGSTTTQNMFVIGAENFNVTIPGTTGSSNTGFYDAGWHQFFLSTQVFAAGTSNYTIANIFRSIEGNYTIIYRYNTTAGWTSYVPGAAGNNLVAVNSTSDQYYVNMNVTDRVEVERRY